VVTLSVSTPYEKKKKICTLTFEYNTMNMYVCVLAKATIRKSVKPENKFKLNTLACTIKL